MYNESMDRPLCIVCNKNLARKRGPDKFRPKCMPCTIGSDSEVKKYKYKLEYERKRRETGTAPRQRSRRGKVNGYQKETSCNSCGFVAAHSCQLDIDHIDGDRTNNSHENLQTLCSNCHRLKTQTEKDYLPLYKRESKGEVK